MTLDSALDWLYATPAATVLRENALLFPWVEGLHVLAITLVFGSITIVDLRLMGLASRERSVDQLSATVLPVTWAAFAVAAISGSLLFASNAPNYAHNLYFRCKLSLIALAGVNMLIFQLVLNPITNRGVAVDSSAPDAVPRSDRIVGALSIGLWIAVIACGRWIGFTMLGGN
jgi:hypothetical protein